MNIRSLLPITAVAVACAAGNIASAQAPSNTAANEVNERANRLAIAEGVLKVDGKLYVVSAGIARRIELKDGQMATLDGLIRPIPPNATLPGGVPKATVSEPGKKPATDPSTTATGAKNTPQAERNKGVGDPSPGASSTSVK